MLLLLDKTEVKRSYEQEYFAWCDGHTTSWSSSVKVFWRNVKNIVPSKDHKGSEVPNTFASFFTLRLCVKIEARKNWQGKENINKKNKTLSYKLKHI